jgi:hypothetical protein
VMRFEGMENLVTTDKFQEKDTEVDKEKRL